MQVATKDTQIQVENPKIELSPAVKELQQKIQDAQTQTISDADLAALYIELGKAYRAQMLFRSAIDTYSIGLTRVPFSKELYRHRGHAYLNLRRYSEGAADFEMALRIDPVYWDALYHLGLCYYLLGDYRRAKAVLARCRAVSADDGSFISATDWYCLCCMRLGEIDEMKEIIINGIMDCSFRNTSYNIVTYNEYPDPIDVDKIHSEVYQEVKDAYYTTNPRMVYAEVQGIDFEDSVEEVKNQIASEQKDEYEVPLKVTNPKVTTEDLGTEAFPNILGSFSTNYATSNRDRTTNLRLAAKKINGTVLMPGETFSYNKVVGERTIEAGYKEAAIYSNGEVTNGLGGGICQITSTLYNAVLYANLEIVQRQNHTFVPSYVKGGRDATVVYGSIDFKFKNDRDYPIKIYASVSGGVAKITIRGLKTENDYEVKLTSRKVDTNYYGGNSYSVYKAYKQLYKNGKLVDTELLSTDTYKNH